ncbi:NAD(P)/FAD-dependent oxidoreductase [Hoyosella rhizosphaerae]|uniref:Monooxygenase n=1 Tax=Hoyosella rhizosphaerae TaxID=1755582 RepID=A0A916U0W3_9ACTN|nr:NAD(P)/FAD-dependent oxidoreductase [Hoyosella rhizosphaerae]MBN4926823.1 NAD(P)/FAD-dependent oxidoreductase [Hoyosella rhizosphaerae]GGC56211.1 putative monooxygenase [Hoyosella rhizosphaerae]
MTRSLRIAIVGAGMSGLAMAAKLLRAGFSDVVIYESADEVGGTWRDNTYPGLSCDVPARFYSYSFAPNPNWSANFAPGDEIQAYFVKTTSDLGLRRLIRFGTEIESATWDGHRYHLQTTKGEHDYADVLIAATGVLRKPQIPDIEGIAEFCGDAFHSARWDHSVKLRGKKIAVIGTGSTGAQITSALAGVAAPLMLFQRTAQWILPLPRLPYSPLSRTAMRLVPQLNRSSYHLYRELMERIFGRAAVEPGWQRSAVSAVCRLHLQLAIRNPALRQKLTPPDDPMCKRLIMSASFYPSVARKDVHLITEAIERVEQRGIRTTDGALHECDVIVFATGFDARAYLRPMDIIGEDGRSLSEAWAHGVRGYRTVAVPGFPNFFTLIGPHSPIGNHSLIAIAETQADYIVQWLESMRSGVVSSCAPSQEATDEFNSAIRDVMPSTVWTTGCNSWYIGPDGVPETWPWTPAVHRQMLAAPVRAHFHITDGARA